MKKFWIQIIALTLVIFAGFYLYANPDFLSSFFQNKPPFKEAQIKIGPNIINVEIADTPSLRTKGLSGRESLTPDVGMLFIFPESKKYQFWMKGMKFPIDMIFINNGTVVDFMKNVPPAEPNQKDSDLPLYKPTSGIDMVLEVSSGYIDKNNIVNGDNVFLIK